MRKPERADVEAHNRDKRRHAITIKTVAEQAGVSTATVSRALNGGGYVSPELHSAVTRAAQELGYTSNAVAAALRSSRSGALGIIVPEIVHSNVSQLVQEVEGFLTPKGVHLILSCSRSDADKEGRAIRSMIARRVDGLIILPAPCSFSRSLMATLGASLPCVELRQASTNWNIEWISGAGEPKAAMLPLVNHLSGQLCPAARVGMR